MDGMQVFAWRAHHLEAAANAQTGHAFGAGGDFAETACSYYLNISEKKNLPKPGSVSVLDMKLRNSSALLTPWLVAPDATNRCSECKL